MIAFVDHAAQRNARLLQRAHVISQVHQQRRVGRQRFQKFCHFAFNRQAAPELIQASRKHTGLRQIDA